MPRRSVKTITCFTTPSLFRIAASCIFAQGDLQFTLLRIYHIKYTRKRASETFLCQLQKYTYLFILIIIVNEYVLINQFSLIASLLPFYQIAATYVNTSTLAMVKENKCSIP